MLRFLYGERGGILEPAVDDEAAPARGKVAGLVTGSAAGPRGTSDDSGHPHETHRVQPLIVGNGMATESLISRLGIDHGWSVRVLGDEPVRHHNRIMLSPLLGEADLDRSPRMTPGIGRAG